MCFSATASFSAGAVLLGFGTLTLKLVRRPRELPFAAIPLLFAIQQLTQGVIWLTFRYEAPRLNDLDVLPTIGFGDCLPCAMKAQRS